MEVGRHEPGEMGDVGHDLRPDLVGDGPERGEVQSARIGGVSDDDHLGTLAAREIRDLLHVDAPVGLAHPVRHDPEELAGEVGRVPMREVPAVLQVHGEDRVPGHELREIDRHVRLRAGVGLYVHRLAAEELLRALLGERLDLVHVDAAAVVALARVPLGVLVREDRALRLEHRLAHVVLGGDQLEAELLPLRLLADRGEDGRIGGREGCRHLWLSI